MTQAELAGSDFTKSFVSQLECGRANPSLRTLRVLSRRLGLSLNDLLAAGGNLQQQLMIACTYVELGDHRQASRILEALLPDTEKYGPELSARICCYLGLAYLGMGKLSQAESALLSAEQDARTCGASTLLIRTLIGLGELYRRQKMYLRSASCWQEAKKLAEATHTLPYLQAEILIRMAELNEFLNDPEQAASMRRQARALLGPTELDPLCRHMIHKWLSVDGSEHSTYKALGLAQALKVLKLHRELTAP